MRQVILLLMALAALLAGQGSAQVRERAFEDLPDDSPDYQVHILYVVPADGADRELDLSGTLDTSVAAGQRWLSGQTGDRRLRLDTYQGLLDITFYRLNRSDAEIRAYGALVRDQVEAELLAAGFLQPHKLYAVYYDGGSSFSCGGAAWPPELIGSAAALYLRGEPPGAPACESNPFAASEETPGYWEFAMLHELVHNLGLVARCAPSHTLNGHVSDDPADLMYAGPLPWQPSILDAGRNDYFEHGAPDCPDLAWSAFLEPAPPEAVPPPGWPYAQLEVTGCDQEPALRSVEAATVAVLQLVNASGQPLHVHWLDYSGQRQFYRALAPYEGFTQNTYLTHPWLVTDADGQCLAIYLPAANPGRAIVRQ